jgi:hypothetical protein
MVSPYSNNAYKTAASPGTISVLLLTLINEKKLMESFVRILTEILTERKGKLQLALASPSPKYQLDRFRLIINKVLYHFVRR